MRRIPRVLSYNLETESFEYQNVTATRTSYSADIVEVSRRHDVFRNSDRATTLVPGAADQLARTLTGGSPHLVRTLLEMDPPDHTLYRRITQQWFLGQNVGSFAERIRPLARRAIDRMVARGDCGCYARGRKGGR